MIKLSKRYSVSYTYYFHSEPKIREILNDQWMEGVKCWREKILLITSWIPKQTQNLCTHHTYTCTFTCTCTYLHRAHVINYNWKTLKYCQRFVFLLNSIDFDVCCYAACHRFSLNISHSCSFRTMSTLFRIISIYISMEWINLVKFSF